MSIFDMFSTKPDAPAAPVNNTQSAPQKALSDPPPSVNANGKMPGTDSTPENPLDVYSKMFENANKNSGIEAPKFSIDPKVLGEVSSKMDFTAGIDQALIQKASSGDAAAMMEIIRKSGQNAYKAALEHNTALTDTFLSSRAEYDGKRVASSVKGQLTDQALSGTPNYSHPVIKAELKRVASAYSRANPDASPAAVAEAAKEYINTIAGALNPTAKADPSSLKDGEIDWDKYLGL